MAIMKARSDRLGKQPSEMGHAPDGLVALRSKVRGQTESFEEVKETNRNE